MDKDKSWEDTTDKSGVDDSGIGLGEDALIGSSAPTPGPSLGSRPTEGGILEDDPAEGLEEELEELKELEDLDKDLIEYVEEDTEDVVSCRRLQLGDLLLPRHMPPAWRNEFEKLLVGAIKKAAIEAVPRIINELSQRPDLQDRTPQRRLPSKRRVHHELLDFKPDPDPDGYTSGPDLPVPVRRAASARRP
ncbi:uncharacterized protein PG998_015086 [Apiospora kogelbergensis]|uniref:uncharacterized protein n=1 Tax=Apiospora kogelbergensis TaxID=1337665 RepID=UPI00312CCBB2